MDRPLQEIMDMHTKISNDPWTEARFLRRKQLEDIRKVKDDERQSNILSWYSKSNTGEQMDRFMWMQKKECEMLRKMQENEEVAKIRQNNERLENVMSQMLEKDKNAALHKDRYSQYLRQNDPQLRQLATQLRDAYVNKIRLAQIDEKERIKTEIAKADIPYVRAMEKLLREEQEKEKLSQFLEDEKKFVFRKQLEAQIKEKTMFDAMNDTAEEDKIRVEAIIKANLEEMQAEKEREFAKKMAVRQGFFDAMRIKAEETEKERLRLKNEEDKLKNYLKHTDDRNEEHRRLKKQREDALHAVQRKLGELLDKKQRDITEFEAARQDVAIAQAEMAAFRNEKTEREDRERAKQKYITELDQFRQTQIVADQEIKARDRELDYKIEMDNKKKQDEHKIRTEKRAERDEIFKKECQEDIIARREEKIRCHEEEMERLKLEIQDNEKYAEEVEQERLAMIKEMAPHLYPGCIPRGMLRDGDIPHLEEPLREFLLSKKSYPDDSDIC